MKLRALLLLAVVAAGCRTAEPEPAPAPPAPPPDTAGVREPPETPPEPAEDDRPYVVMVSFDGMRYDFPDRVSTPNLDRIAARGAQATGLIPSYPSKTFPNHYTLATGLYPSSHGIVDNVFYDPAFNAVYALGDTATVRDGRWYRGEPIWVTAERQGLHTASFFWVGSEASIQGTRPTYFKYYDDAFPNAERVDTILQWLQAPLDRRPQLVMLYFSTVDHVAHRAGPDAAAVDSAVVAMDALVGRLVDGLAALPVADRINLVVVSDHGMVSVPRSNVVRLDDLVDLHDVRVINNRTQALLYFGGDEARMWEVFEALGERLTHATAFLREESPERWHYRRGRRIGDVIVAADPGWVITTAAGRPWTGGGMHGWDPYDRRMHGIFLAAGPGIRAGTRLPAFENVHVYPFIAHLLGLEPATGIDGRLDVLEAALAEPAYSR